jgi:hypothetical protein
MLQTAFNFFAAEQWAALRGELGANAAPQDISRLIGERWSKATDDERAPFVAKAQEDKTRYEKEMDDWRSSMEAVAAAAAADSAAAAADGEAVRGSQGGEAMDVDGAAAGVKQEQRSATPPKALHPKIKLKMTGPGRHGTPPPAAAAAAVQEGAGGAAAADGAEAGSTQQRQQQQQEAAPVPAAAAAAPLESPVLPDAPEPVRQFEQQQQQEVLQHSVADIGGPAAAGGASLHPAAAAAGGAAALGSAAGGAGALLMDGAAADAMQLDDAGAGGEQQ